MRLPAGLRMEFAFPSGYNNAQFLLYGSVVLNDAQLLAEVELALFGSDGEDFAISAETNAVLLLLNDEPILEPVARRGSFVMNTEEEPRHTEQDYQAGKIGQL